MAGVGHGVAKVTVGADFHQGRLAFGAREGNGLEGLGADIIDIHAVGLDRGHVEGAGALGERVAGGGAGDAGAHGVLVVLDNENDRKFPERREVHRLMDRALVDRAVTHVGQGNSIGVEIFLRVSNADTERNLPADDAVTAIKMLLHVEEMHRTALAARAAGDFAEEFRHAGIRIDAAREGVAVIAVGGDDRVVVVKDGNRADGDRFLAVVEVAKTLDLGLGECLFRLFLKPADEDHLTKEGELFLGI